MKEIIATLGAEHGATPTAIKKWRQRGVIPAKYWLKIFQTAVERGLPIDEKDLTTKKPPKPGKSAKKRKAV